MDFQFFEQLSKDDTKLYLEWYLSEVKEGFKKLLPNFEKEQITIDFSVESIVPVLTWVKSNLKTIPEKKDENLPSWITETESYMKGLYSFDEHSKILMLRASYYLGECFVRNNKTLSWSTGRSKTAEVNMPVITGFKKKIELAPMLVTENLIRGLVEGDDLSRINSVLEHWKKII